MVSFAQNKTSADNGTINKSAASGCEMVQLTECSHLPHVSPVMASPESCMVASFCKLK